MYDVFMLTYKEPNGDENFNRLLELRPDAIRIDNIKGILNAHKACAEKSSSQLFYVVDGDNWIYDNFDFKYKVIEGDENAIHVWRCKNPVNGLVYGYGAVKLFPKSHVEAKAKMALDMSTSLSPKYKIIHEIASETRFNTDPYNSWKSAFRECIKLASGLIKNSKQEESAQRLETWCTKGSERPFGKWCILGAQMAREYVEKYSKEPDKLANINDFDWLESEFERIKSNYDFDT